MAQRHATSPTGRFGKSHAYVMRSIDALMKAIKSHDPKMDGEIFREVNCKDKSCLIDWYASRKQAYITEINKF
jgi:hypothetical protein